MGDKYFVNQSTITVDLCKVFKLFFSTLKDKFLYIII